jgi:hypothetical protein
LQVAYGQFGRLVGPRTTVIQKEQKRVVASAKGSALIRLLQQGINLVLFEVPDRRFGSLLERNRPYLAAPGKVSRRVRAYEPHQRMDHGKPLVARDATATAVALQVIKELTKNGRRQILDCHPIDGASGAGTGERQQQGQRVTVAGLRIA